jgi:hypothetical protein
MIRTIKRLSGVAIGACGVVFASAALADGTSLKLINPLGTTDLTKVLGDVNVFLLAVAAPICGIMVVWGGFQMITSAGNPEKFSSGKKTLLYAAVGFVVVIFSSSVMPLMQSVFGGS